MESEHVKSQSLLYFLLTKFRACCLFLSGVLIVPEFSESFRCDEFSMLNSALNIVERTVTILDLFVEFRKFPCKSLSMLPRDVLSSQFVEYFAELLELFLILTRVELKGTFHDATIVEIGNVDNVGLPGVLGPSFLLVFVSELGEESDDDSHLRRFLLNYYVRIYDLMHLKSVYRRLQSCFVYFISMKMILTLK